MLCLSTFSGLFTQMWYINESAMSIQDLLGEVIIWVKFSVSIWFLVSSVISATALSGLFHFILSTYVSISYDYAIP